MNPYVNTQSEPMGTDGQTDKWTDKWTNGRTNGQTDGQMDKRTNGRTDKYLLIYSWISSQSLRGVRTCMLAFTCNCKSKVELSSFVISINGIRLQQEELRSTYSASIIYKAISVCSLHFNRTEQLAKQMT